MTSKKSTAAPAPRAAAKSVKPASEARASAPARVPRKTAPARPQLVRDSFTMPQEDFALIHALKSRAMDARRHAKKSELLRAGLRALATMDAKTLVENLDRLQAVKVGRPRKGH